MAKQAMPNQSKTIGRDSFCAVAPVVVPIGRRLQGCLNCHGTSKLAKRDECLSFGTGRLGGKVVEDG